jgi:nucleoid-associated protein EbfC
MFENLTNFSKLVRGAGQMMPRIQAMKDKMAQTDVESQSSSGRVLVILSGSGTLKRLEIDQEMVDTGDKVSLESEIAETINQAIQRAKQIHLQAVQEIVGDLGIPGVDRMLAQLAE